MKPPVSSRIVRYLTAAILALALLSFAYVTVGSFIGTSMLDPNDYWGEHILFLSDTPLPRNITVLAAVFLLLTLLRRPCSKLTARCSLPLLCGVVLAALFVFGAVYLKQVQPEVSADARVIMRASQDFLNGDYSAISTTNSYFGRYFHDYPFQLGLVLFYQILQGIVGAGHLTTLAMVNVFALTAAYAGILCITHKIFCDRSITLFTLLLFALFFQGVLYCALLYGAILCLCCAVWAMFFLVCYIRSSRTLLLLPIAVLSGLAVTFKLNAMVMVVAISICLLLFALIKRKWTPLLAAVLCVLSALSLPAGVKAYYEHRAGARLTPGAISLNWLALGLSESDRAPGWHSPMPYDFSPEKREETAQLIQCDIRERIALFHSDPAYAGDFFRKKIMSQWDEPTFQSIWVSRIKKLDQDMPPLVDAIYSSSMGGGLFLYFRYQVQCIYFFFLIGLSVLLFYNTRRTSDASQCLLFALLPLTALGSFLFHTLAEAKSQYVLIYVLLMFPMTALGMQRATDWLARICFPFGKKTRKDSLAAS